MDKLKVCFVGIGSIGKRHIINLSSICYENEIALTIDALRKKNKSFDVNIQHHIRYIFTDERELPDDYDILFITNPTSFHLETLKKLHGKAKHFFIEKPLCPYERVGEISDIEYRSGSVYYVACPLRYTNVIQYLKQNVRNLNVISVRCISSSYLPDWRPDIDYRETYSADRKLGGGVRIDLIHEWDYIKYLFGIPNRILYTFGKKSLLDLNCEDYAVYIADYADKVLELHLDYFGRKTLRKIMLFTYEDTIVGDLVANRIVYLKGGRKILFQEESNDCYKKEMMHFLDIVDGKAVCDNAIIDAYKTLLLTQGEVK